MNDLEKELRKVLRTKGDFDVGKAEARRKEIEQMILHKYELDFFKVKVVYWIFFVLCLGMMAGGYIGLRSANDTKAMLCWVIFFMIGFNSTILMKLWYWVVDTKLKVLKEMKQLQLQVAGLAGKEPPVKD
jgi:hypothetical protein